MASAVGCSDQTSIDVGQIAEISCSINQSLIFGGGPGRDGIPALTNPTLVDPGHNEIEYLRDDDRVVGIILDSEPVAIPLNIFWWHEIVNISQGSQQLAITHCPLTGSSLAFDRAAAGGAEFGVSGLLFQNNLIMYDRTSNESLWPQMFRSARCGSKDGITLDMVPLVEMTWEGWRALHPNTKVVSSNTGFNRDYTAYPYGNYDRTDNSSLLFPMSVDTRRPAKERALGIPVGTGGIAFPYGVLDGIGPVAKAQVELEGKQVVVFWSRQAQAAMAYDAEMNGEPLTFSITNGEIIDDQTGSSWNVEGIAVAGPSAGFKLDPMEDAFVAFWFAWPAFYEDIQIWSAS